MVKRRIIKKTDFRFKPLMFIGGLFLLMLIFQKIFVYSDFSPTVIIEKNIFFNIPDKNILKGEKVAGEFKAKHNNLGTVSIKFDTQNRINDDFVQFSIKEKGGNEWYYSNKYKVDQFQNNQYFPFGFPEIQNSKNKKYQIEIMSLNGSAQNSVKVSTDTNIFISKYSFPKKYLLENKSMIPLFLINKIKSYFFYIETIFYLYSLVFFILIFLLIKLDISKQILNLFKKSNNDLYKKKLLIFYNKNFKKRTMLSGNKIEFLVVIILYFLLTIFLSKILYLRNMHAQYGDTTFAAQVLMNIGKNFSYDSSFSRSIVYSFGNIWYKSADDVCKSILITPNEFPPWGHFYFISFILGSISKYFNIFSFMALSHALIYSSILLFVYIIARKLKVNTINSILLVLIASQHPLWYQGFYGQFYFNRFFLLFCSVIIFLLSYKKLNYILIFLFTLLAISTNEVYGVALFIVFLIYLFLFKLDKKIILFSLISLIISTILIVIIQKTAEPNLTQNALISNMFSGGFLGILKNIFGIVFSNKSGLFLLINLIFGGIVVLIKPKLFVMWIFLLIPNLLVDIGKIGWSTHYHISYFVPVLWLLVYAVSLIKFKNKILLTFCLILYFIFISRFNVENLRIEEPIYAANKMYQDYKMYSFEDKNISKRFNGLRSVVKDTDKISLPEAFSFPFVDHEIYYYPADIDRVDKVILLYDKEKTGDDRFSSINYGHQDINLDKCILKRMRINNFELDNPVIYENLAIIGKK